MWCEFNFDWSLFFFIKFSISILIYRLLPIVGQYKISDVAEMTRELHSRFGKIVRLGGLIGRPDLLFVNDANEIEKVREYLVCLVKKSQIQDDGQQVIKTNC